MASNEDWKSDCITFQSSMSNKLGPAFTQSGNGIVPSKIAKFKSSATSWGCEHEKTAISKYLSINLRKHHNFEVKECVF